MAEAARFVMRDIPVEERPRERMLEVGANGLSNAELLAILLRTGVKNISAVQLAQKVLLATNGLPGLAACPIGDLTSIHGLGQAKAVQLKAGIELGRRLTKTSREALYTIKSPEDAASYLMEDLRYLEKEQFVCLFLNTKNQVSGQEVLSIGSLNASIVHPREVFRAAIRSGCASVLCAHNHPSGDPTPSPEDISITKRLVEVGDLVGIPVIDHLVIGDRSFVSLKQRGLI